MTLGELLGGREVPLVDGHVSPAWHCRVEDVRPDVTRERAGLADVRTAVDRVVDRLAEVRVALEQAIRHVQRQVAGAVLRLRPETGLVLPVLVRNTLNLIRRKRVVLVDLVRLRLVEERLLGLVPEDVQTGQVVRPRAAGALRVVRVLPDRRQLVDVVARVEVWPGRRQVAAVDRDDFLVERELGRSCLEERHRDLRHERTVSLRQVDDELVALDDDAADVLRQAVVHLFCPDDVRAARVSDELRAGRGEILVRHPVDRVLEVLRGHCRAITELEALPERERVHLAVPRHGELRGDLRHELRANRAGLVRIVVELRCGRVLEPPRGGDVSELRVDLD